MYHRLTMLSHNQQTGCNMNKKDRIVALCKAAEAMAHGHFAPDIPVGDDDVGYLGRSLKKLSRYLQKQAEQHQSLYRIMVECHLNLRLIDILNHIYESFQHHLPYDRISLALLDNDGSKLKLHWVRACYNKLELDTGYYAPATHHTVKTIFAAGKELVIDDLRAYLEQHPDSSLVAAACKEGIQSCLICPLIATGKPAGFILFSSRKKNVYKKLHRDLSLQIASQLAVIIERTRLYKNIKLNRQLIAQKKTLQQKVTHDALTGLFNRPAIFDRLRKDILRARRGGFGIAVIMIDIDHFKQINDRYGHQTGDAVLVDIAERLTQSARAHEYIGRYGGEEFLAIVSPYDQDGALRAAERFRDTVASKTVHNGEIAIPVTISLGVAIARTPELLDENLLIKAADEALYAAKHNGRNRVELAKLASPGTGTVRLACN